MKLPHLLGVFGLILPLSAALAATPIAPRGAFASSQGGGKQDKRTFSTGSKTGQIDIFYDMQDVDDRFTVFNGGQHLFDLDVDYTTGTGSVGTVYDGNSKLISVIFNPGGNPNPTTSWSYAAIFTYNDGSSDYQDIFSVYTDLDDRVIPGVDAVTQARNSAVDLTKSVTAFIRAFPPTVSLVVDPRDRTLALVLPTKQVDADDVSNKYNKFLDDSSNADNAFDTLINISFDDITNKLDDLSNQLANLPGDLSAAQTMIDFIYSHQLGVEQTFEDIDSARDERDSYNSARSDSTKAFLSQVKKTAILRRAAGLANNVMRSATKRTGLDELEALLALSPLERAILNTSHSGIAARIR